MPVTGVKKGHDMMNKNLLPFPCLRITTFIMIFPLFFQQIILHQVFGVHSVKKVEMNILKVGICLTITNKSRSYAKKSPPVC